MTLNSKKKKDFPYFYVFTAVRWINDTIIFNYQTKVLFSLLKNF